MIGRRRFSASGNRRCGSYCQASNLNLSDNEKGILILWEPPFGPRGEAGRVCDNTASNVALPRGWEVAPSVAC